MKKLLVCLLLLIGSFYLFGNEIIDLKVKIKKGTSIVTPVDEAGDDGYGYFSDTEGYGWGGFQQSFYHHNIEDHTEASYSGSVEKRDVYDFLLYRRRKNVEIILLILNFSIGSAVHWFGFVDIMIYGVYANIYPPNPGAITIPLTGIILACSGLINIILGIVGSVQTGKYVKKMRKSKQKIIDALNRGIPNSKDTVRIRFDLRVTYM